MGKENFEEANRGGDDDGTDANLHDANDVVETAGHPQEPVVSKKGTISASFQPKVNLWLCEK